MTIFGAFGQPAVTLSVHPRTTEVVVQAGAASNVLVGYVQVQVHRPTVMHSLAVRFTGNQRLDMRDGQGPSSTLHSVRRQCADITHTIADCTGSSADMVGAAMTASLARVRRTCDDSGRRSPPMPQYAESGDLQLSSFSSAEGVELRPGEYRFMFELALPSRLAGSVHTALGKVEYQVGAELRRSARLFSTVEAPAVRVRVVQAPRLDPGSAQLLGFGSFTALASAPLLVETTCGGGKVSVYSPSSRALFVGAPLKLQVYVTPQAGARRALAEFGAVLYERATHRVPGSAAPAQTTERVVAASALCPWACAPAKQREAQAMLDPQMIDALGESFDELPSAGSLNLKLPARVQTAMASPMFTVSHRLVVTASVCAEGEPCAAPERVTLATNVLVLPESLDSGEHAAAPLPSYSHIGCDVVLAAEAPSRPDSALGSSPPAYAALYMCNDNIHTT
ncbi:hypothetical protein H4R23_001515 [Coemansia sp. Cherry 401B]|nr:hypothetical protein IWW52_001639 [Coemansia sp. RSA 2704]KAJ2737904.1 hypothetical protein H4R23_001515 [Coemansia sp. Cherry 401B]